MGKGSAARLASKNAASKPSTPTSELRKLKEKSLRLEKNLRAAKDEIKTLKMDLSREKKEKSRHQEELEKQQLLFQFQKNNLEEQFERDRNMEKDSYTNQVDNLSRESERIQRKWTSEVNTLTANYKEVTKELKSLGDLAGNIVASENAGPIRVTNVEFTKKVEEMSGKVEAVRSACVAILLNATNSPLPTCKSCQVVFEEEEQEVEIVPRPPTGRLEAPTCQICLIGFSSKEGHVPRILRCGHTLCESCAQQIQKQSKIECPFDRIATLLLTKNAAYLPKNFSILEIVEGELSTN